MYLAPYYQQGVSWLLFLDGTYEKSETELFKKIVKEGMTVVDLGANTGYYTLLAAKLVGEKGKVFAFEPEPRNFSVLMKTIQLNGYINVVAIQKAVSNKNGTARLILSDSDPGQHSVYEKVGKDSIQVDITTMDTFWGNQGYPPIDVIKMDIEGAEMEALEGMGNLISNNSHLKIITELVRDRLERRGFSTLDFLNKLVELGFQLSVFTCCSQLVNYNNCQSVLSYNSYYKNQVHQLSF